MSVNMTTLSYATETTTKFLLGKYMLDEVAVWVHLAIVILGLITNPMILIVLRKKTIGSELLKTSIQFLHLFVLNYLLIHICTLFIQLDGEAC